jgi:hypothetical protein
MRRLKPNLAALIPVVTALVMMGTARAQRMPPGTISADQSIAQSVIVSTPPANFNPLTASAKDLEDSGFPPPPDPVKSPADYARWQRLVSVPRVSNPKGKVLQTNIYHTPVRILSSQTLRNGTETITTDSWSGYAVVAPTYTFTVNGSNASGEWVVPTAQQALGVCNGFTDFSSQWVGLGGVSQNALLQAGTNADACCGDCGGPIQTAMYDSWIEFFPFPQMTVPAPAARQGDLMSVEVWYTTDGVGHAILANFTLGEAAEYNFPQPNAIFAGDSAEWIMERPTLYNGTSSFLPDLTNYTADQFNNDFASNISQSFSPSSSPASTTIAAITMTCPPWTPSESCPAALPLSIPNLYPPSALWFYAFPPAQ